MSKSVKKRRIAKRKNISYARDPHKVAKNQKYVQKSDWKPQKYKKTELEQINSDPKKVAEKVQELIDKGRVLITTKEELENFPKGSVVSYITKEGKYRSGGFLTSIQPDYFTLHGGTKFAPVSFCVQFSNVKEMYVGKVDRSRKITKIVPVPITQEITNYPVFVGDIVVKYEKDKWKQNRFMQSKKYKAMVEFYNQQVKEEEEEEKKNSKKKKRKVKIKGEKTLDNVEWVKDSIAKLRRRNKVVKDEEEGKALDDIENYVVEMAKKKKEKNG